MTPTSLSGDVIPLFSTSGSLKDGGIFTVDKAGAASKAGRKHGPVSLCDLAKSYQLTQIHLVEDRFVNFMAAYKALKDVGCALTFGLKLTVCDDMADKSDTSTRNESKVVIWMAGDGSADYRALISLYTVAAQDGFYYVPRLDWKTLKANWHDDLILSLPFYSSFLARNATTFASIVPDLPATPLLLREVGQEIPTDTLLNDAVERYAAATGAPIQPVRSVYYQDRTAAKSWQVWRCILNRKTYDLPNDDVTSSEFAWMRRDAA